MELFGQIFPRAPSERELATRRQSGHQGYVTAEDIALKRGECHIFPKIMPIRRCHLGHEM